MDKSVAKKRIAPAAAVLLLLVSVLLLTACEDLAVFMEHLDDDVMVANDRYLQVLETIPGSNDMNLSPKIPLRIVFDREVDPDDIRSYFEIVQYNADGNPTEFGDSASVEEELEFEFSGDTLTVTPSPFWEGGSKVSVTILAGAPGIDGSYVRTPVSWSFFPEKYPLGAVDVVESSDASDGYTAESTPELKLVFSNAGEYFLTENEAKIDTADYDSWNWQAAGKKTGELTILDYTDFTSSGDLSASVPDGDFTVYAVYKDPATNTVGDKMEATITVDSTNPVATGTGFTSIGPENTEFSKSAAASDADTAVREVLWYSDPSGVTFGTPDANTTTIAGPGGTDQAYDIYFEVTDMAGNTDTDSFSLDWDSQAPTAPAFTSVPDAESTDVDTPTWEWVASVSDDAQSPYYYRLYYDSTSWSTITETSYTSAALPDGRHRFDIGQYDDAGNLGYRYDYCIINTANIDPYDTETGVAYSRLTLDWPGATILGFSYGYQVYTSDPDKNPLAISVASGTGLSASTVNLSVTLFQGVTYYWRYSASSKLGTTVSDVYTFTTTPFGK